LLVHYREDYTVNSCGYPDQAANAGLLAPCASFQLRPRQLTSNNILKLALDQGIFSCAQWAVWHRGAQIDAGAIGNRSFTADSPSIDSDTLFDLASLTKPLATSLIALQLAGAHELELTAPVASMWPLASEANEQWQHIAVRDLLTHTSGLPEVPLFPANRSQPDLGPSGCRDAVILASLNSPVRVQPGTEFRYSDTGYIVTSGLVEDLTGQRLDVLFAANIAAKMGITELSFVPDPAQRSFAETDPAADVGMVHDPRARFMSGVAGHAGLFGTANCVATLANAILSRDSRLLPEAVWPLIFNNQITETVGRQSLGWFLSGSPYLPTALGISKAAIGHSGFTGCLLIIDPERNLTATLLTNRVLNAEQDGTDYLALRRQWAASIL